MRVLLIIPPSGFLLDERVFPSLGVLKVAAVLEQAGHQVQVLDFSGRTEGEIDTMLVSWAWGCDRDVQWPEVIGLTATMPQMPAAAAITRRLWDFRAGFGVNTRPVLVLGGPHVTLLHASVKQEQRRARPGRATRALQELEDLFDVLICGDGEHAILQLVTALRLGAAPPKLIDADDPAGPLFLTPADLNTAPFPARHLIDLASYRYQIDGHKTHSLIGQLGCLAAGTQILLPAGNTANIEDIKPGQDVLCFTDGGFRPAPVVAAWRRQAQDLWRLSFSDGTALYVTSEHPLWTPNGWRPAADVWPGDAVGSMPGLWGDEGFIGRQMPDLPLGLGTASGASGGAGEICGGDRRSEAGQASRPSRGHAASMGPDEQRGAARAFKHQAFTGGDRHPARAKIVVRHQARRAQSHEAPRGGGESIGHYEGKTFGIVPRSNASGVAGGPHTVHVADGPDLSVAHAAGTPVSGFVGGFSPTVSLYGESGLLGGPIPCRQATQPRFRLHSDETGHSGPRRILAPRSGRCVGRNTGLHGLWLGGARYLGGGVTTQEPAGAHHQTGAVRFKWLVDKEFIGGAEVYNITVCPGHSYVANATIVHNCPFGCTFCGGRRSPFLRRVRTRTTANVVAEVRHLYEAHGATGFMFLDDELNVNMQFLDLLHQLSELQATLGVDFVFRGLLKAQLLTEPMAVAMADTGFRQILVGFESGDERILRNMNKQATRDENTRCVETLQRHGITVKALMSVGHAGESPASIEATRQWLLAVRPEDFDVTIITVYPGTPYYDDAEPGANAVEPPALVPDRAARPTTYTYTDPRNGDRLHMVDVDHLHDVNFYKGVPGAYRSFVWTDHISREDLVRARDDVEADVRAQLGIPYPTGPAATQYEHSMGLR